MRVAAIAPARDITSELIAFLNDAPGARTALAMPLRRRLALATKKIVPRWNASLREEVLQQAFVTLLENPGRYDHARGSASSFLFQVVREAARTIRAAYASPAAPKRARHGATPTPAPMALDDVTDKEAILFAQAHHANPEAMTARCDIRHLAPRMPPELVIAFTSLAEGETKVFAAQAAGLTRFQLEARMSRFRRDLQLAA